MKTHRISRGVFFAVVGTMIAIAPAEAGPFSQIMSAPDEKHQPVITAPDVVVSGEPFSVTIAVGKKAHPSEDKHHVQWIALLAGGIELARVTLTPTLTQPTVTFTIMLEESTTLVAMAMPNHSAAWQATRPITVKPKEVPLPEKP